MPSVSSGVAAFTGMRPKGHRWTSGVVGYSGFALGAVGFILGDWVHWGTPSVTSRSSGVAGFTVVRPVVCHVHPGSLGSLDSALGVVWLIRGRLFHWSTPLG